MCGKVPALSNLAFHVLFCTSIHIHLTIVQLQQRRGGQSVVDLRVAVGGNLLPFMMKTQLGAQFLARRVPLILTQIHFFFQFSF